MLDAPDDVWYRPYEHATAVEDAMRAYLDWELALVGQLNRDATIDFPDVAPA